VQVTDGRTIRWTGEYGYDLNEARTLETHLGVLAEFRPELPPAFRRCPFVFLANLDPVIQLDVLRGMARPRLVALDTMNFWIEGKRDDLRAVLREVDALLVNDAEARMLAGEPNLVRAARLILAWGPRVVVVKRGEYGALMATPERFFFAPAYPLDSVFDPTGAGDSFAGGFMGVLAGAEATDEAVLRRAIVYGSVIASFTVEDFSLNRLRRLTRDEIDARYRVFREMMQVER
jgi:sugar/nucleoside kinase (ribokinase family)